MEELLENLTIDSRKTDDLTGSGENSAFDKIKSQANELFMKKDYESAIHMYKKALELQPDSAVIHLNLAQAYLNTGYFFDALPEAKLGLHLGGDKKKALYRAGKAAYGLCLWEEAVKFFGDLLAEDPNVIVWKNELKKSKARLH